MSENKKILLGMSGGTDSSVSALLLRDSGYEVTGITFRFYEKDNNQEYLEDAQTTCRELDIPHIIYDARDIFEKTIINYFITGYLSGKTPVPCVICNNQLKWPLLAKIADQKDINYISTGHYSRMIREDEFLHFMKGKDPDKDQSFFLWGLQQDLMKRIILPLGNYTKAEVRSIAEKRGLKKAAVKKDSIGVCFCPGDYESFLRQRLGDEAFKEGLFYDTSGNMIGKHKGYPFYTIGQRRGLGVNFQQAVFVKEINIQSNSIILDHLSGLYKNKMILQNFNLINESRVINHPVICKIRYRKQATPCLVEYLGKDQLSVHFLEPLESIAPGQAAAFYDNDILLGGGIIVQAF